MKTSMYRMSKTPVSPGKSAGLGRFLIDSALQLEIAVTTPKSNKLVFSNRYSNSPFLHSPISFSAPTVGDGVSRPVVFNRQALLFFAPNRRAIIGISRTSQHTPSEEALRHDRIGNHNR